jgi:thiosulfate reductase cytochrome b subunit
MERQTAEARFRGSRWFALVWVLPLAVVTAVVVVLLAQWARQQAGIQSFVAQYPGQSTLPAGAPVGFPAWLSIQHFLNAVFMLFVLRTAWQLRSKKRPDAFWMRGNSGVFRTKNPPIRIGLPLWFHLSIDALWVVNGLVYIVLLFATGQWMRLVPTRWDLIPNAASAALQYASLDWPIADGWVNYNALQQLAYFATVFIAAPLALASGIRLSPGLAAALRPLDRVVPMRATRLVHVGTWIWFLTFIAAHVTLVLATGAVRNLNHMYAGRNDDSWWGFAIFAASLVVMIVAWFAARPAVLAAIAGRTGTVRG